MLCQDVEFLFFTSYTYTCTCSFPYEHFRWIYTFPNVFTIQWMQWLLHLAHILFAEYHSSSECSAFYIPSTCCKLSIIQWTQLHLYPTHVLFADHRGLYIPPTSCLLNMIQWMQWLLQPTHRLSAERHSVNAIAFRAHPQVVRWTPFVNAMTLPAHPRAVRWTSFSECNGFYSIPTGCPLNVIQWMQWLLQHAHRLSAERHSVNATAFTANPQAVRWPQFSECNGFYSIPTGCPLNVIQWMQWLLQHTHRLSAERHSVNAMALTAHPQAVSWTSFGECNGFYSPPTGYPLSAIQWMQWLLQRTHRLSAERHSVNAMDFTAHTQAVRWTPFGECNGFYSPPAGCLLNAIQWMQWLLQPAHRLSAEHDSVNAKAFTAHPQVVRWTPFSECNGFYSIPTGCPLNAILWMQWLLQHNHRLSAERHPVTAMAFTATGYPLNVMNAMAFTSHPQAVCWTLFNECNGFYIPSTSFSLNVI